MRLKKLQISGFKSFVDSTDVRLPADLVAVVGPNGCGKSNIIDAVRWVMGESSAKMLRGDSMTDVIFNGSTARKPVGKASVELLFDNTDGSVGGSFASFAEISVQRTLSRDGNSTYLINRIKTRRKDVLDLFRGTGLGPRSYSIIEQGMVSRIVEARPDDLRSFVEEAAGTSKYKDRRRETELRIGHTRDNLDRVADIRDELEKQLRRLQRQANAAKRFTRLKDEQRLAHAQLLMLRLLSMNEKLAQQERVSAQHENDLEAALAAQRATEASIEKLRDQHAQAQQKHHEVQQENHSLASEITNREQRIEHLSETRQRQSEEIERLQSSQTEQLQQLESDKARLVDLQTEQSELAPKHEQIQQRRLYADEQLSDAEVELQNWQSEWETFNEQAQAPARQQEVQQSRIAQLQQHLERSNAQITQIEQELASARELLTEVDIAAVRAEVKQHDDACERSEHEFQQLEAAIQSLQQSLQQKRDENSQLRAQQHETQSRLTSLKQIQRAALGDDDTALQEWFARNDLGQQPKLATRLRVADGWERATDRLMNGFLGALCVDEMSDEVLAQRPDCAFTLVTTAEVKSTPDDTGRTRLLDMVEADATDMAGFLGGVYVADSLTAAVAMQPTLGNRECAVTQDGTLVGANWISFASKSQLETGVLVREDEMKQLQVRVRQLETQVSEFNDEVAQLETQLEAQQQQAQQHRNELNQLRQRKTEMHSTLGRKETQYHEAEQRVTTLTEQLDSLGEHVQSDGSEISKARELLQHATEQQASLDARRDTLLQQKSQHQNNVTQRKDELSAISEQIHEHALDTQRLEAEVRSATEGIARNEQQLQAIDAQIEQIKSALDIAGDPAGELKIELQRMLERRVHVEQRLSETSDVMAQFDTNLQQINEQRTREVAAVTTARETLNQYQLQQQEIRVRRTTQIEQIEGIGYDLTTLEAELPEDADIDKWEVQHADLEEKINRIGAVNLVAIEEFDEQSERKEYLDKQYADLNEALETLRNVIQKIDRETKSLFKDTFDRLNEGFNEFFPQLFGGGKAELQLTSDDFLTTGIVVMARPPGKRNSHIHLLSGGEKALTAVALLFSLFKLNPAPFCMLDEVDAPLDDANVERYCTTLKTLVKASQMIVITHNKVTMEAADALIGVTMSEPGVSRLVSVDVDQAVEIAAQ